MMRGRPAVYATFAAYDEVAHHSGTERADTMEALRKLDQTFLRIDAARRYAPRPYEIAVLSDHGQTRGDLLQRNGYGLRDLVEEPHQGAATALAAGDENDTIVSRPSVRQRDTDKAPGKIPCADAVVLGRVTSGSSTSWRSHGG